MTNQQQKNNAGSSSIHKTSCTINCNNDVLNTALIFINIIFIIINTTTAVITLTIIFHDPRPYAATHTSNTERAPNLY